MKALLRFGIAAAAAVLAFGQGPAAAQNTTAPTTNTQANETVGPRELEDFSLNGTVTRQAETPTATTAPAPAAEQPAAATAEPGPARGATVRAPARTATADAPPVSAPGSQRQAQPVTAGTTPLAQPTPAPGLSPAASPFTPLPSTTLPQSTEGAPSQLPWLLAALALVAGGMFLFWRQRSRNLAYAGAADVDYAPAEPAPAPAPKPAPLARAPAPPPATPPVSRPTPAPLKPAPGPASSVGIVSTSLRPWLDFEFEPKRCVVENGRATIEFDLVVRNSGSGPARDILVEARMFSAGPNQDQEIAEFFTNPVASGERLPVIEPMRKLAFSTSVSLAGEHFRPVEIEGRTLLVPLIGFNALYRWSGGDAQSSTSFLVGRDTQREKLAPFRLDQGARTFTGLGARENRLRLRK